MEEAEEVTLRIENSPRLGGLGYLVLTSAELKEVGVAILPHVRTLRRLHPLQLVDLLRRLCDDKAIKTWSLSKSGKLIGSSHVETEANTTSPVDTVASGDQLSPHVNLLPQSIPKSTGIDPLVDIQEVETVAPGGKETEQGRSMVHESPANPSVAQTARLVSKSSLHHSIIRNSLTTPVDSPRKRQRAATASAVPSLAGQSASEQPPPETSSIKFHVDQLATVPDHTIHLLREACKVKEGSEWLNERDLGKVLRLSTQLIDSDPRGVLEPQLKSWRARVSQGLHALGLPKEWVGVEAAATYYTMLSTNRISDPVGQRVARMLLALNYETICAAPETYCPRSRQGGEKRASYVVSCITDACYARASTKKERDNMHDYLRQGRLLWTMASVVGLGFVLICSHRMVSAIMNVRIALNRIQAIAAYTLYTRPGLVALLHSLESAVADLIFGNISNGLSDAVQDEAGVLGQSALSRINEEDRVNLAHQYNANSWEPIEFGLAVYNLKTRLRHYIQTTSRVAYSDPGDKLTPPLGYYQPDGQAATDQRVPTINEGSSFGDSQLDHGHKKPTLAASVNQYQQDDDASTAQWGQNLEDEMTTNSQIALDTLDEMFDSSMDNPDRG